jgi:hypothetical protein
MAAPAANLQQNFAFRLNFESGPMAGRSAQSVLLRERAPRCFCCFCRKLSAAEESFTAETLDSRRCDEGKNSGTTSDAGQPRPLIVKDEEIRGCIPGAMSSDQKPMTVAEVCCLDNIINNSLSINNSDSHDPDLLLTMQLRQAPLSVDRIRHAPRWGRRCVRACEP